MSHMSDGELQGVLDAAEAKQNAADAARAAKEEADKEAASVEDQRAALGMSTADAEHLLK